MQLTVAAPLMRAIFFGLLALAAGCTAHLRPHPDVRISAEPLALKAVLVVPPELNQSVDSVGGFDGISGSYAFDTGELLVPAVKDVAKRVFASVEVVPNASAAPKADVVIILKRLKLVHPRSDLTLRFDFSAKVENAEGIQILDAVYNDELKAVVAREPSDAITSPVEKAIAATLERLAADLRASTVALVPPPVAPAPAVIAADGAPAPEPAAVATADGAAAPAPPVARPPVEDFSEFPPPPPPPGGVSEQPVVAAAAPPPAAEPAPAPAPVAAAPAPAVTVEKTQPTGGGGKRAVLISTGLILFAGGYATIPALMNLQNWPGGMSELVFIPFAGPLLTTLQNPYLSQDTTALAVTIACTAAQVAGLVFTIAGIASGGSKRLAVLPTATASSVGVAVVVH